MHSDDSQDERPDTIRSSIWEALRAAHRRRPISFYLLLSFPIILLLGLTMIRFIGQPKMFAMVLGLLFLFCGAVLLGALADLFDILRRGLADRKRDFRETLGEDTFVQTLGKRVDAERAKHEIPK
jgi:hypothetical protein